MSAQLQASPAIDQLRLALQALANEPRFAWLGSIPLGSSEDYIISRLAAQTATSGRYSPYAIHKNVSIANDLANRCLTKRSQILELESKAIEAAVAFQRDLASLDPDFRLSSIRIRAELATIGAADLDQAMQDLQLQRDLREKNIATRLTLHNSHGSPLNYGEQVEFLRQIQADNLQTLMELNSAIASGVRDCYSLSEDAFPNPPNRYDSPDSLNSMVLWLREAIKFLELLELNERSRVVYIPVLKAIELLGENVAEAYQSLLTNQRISLSVNEQVLALSGVTLLPGERPRISGASIALVPLSTSYLQSGSTDAILAHNIAIQNANTAISRLAFPCSIEFPTQTLWVAQSAVDAGLISLPPPETSIEQLSPAANDALENFSPLGEWSIELHPDPLFLPSSIPASPRSIIDLHALLPDNDFRHGARFELILCLGLNI